MSKQNTKIWSELHLCWLWFDLVCQKTQTSDGAIANTETYWLWTVTSRTNSPLNIIVNPQMKPENGKSSLDSKSPLISPKCGQWLRLYLNVRTLVFYWSVIPCKRSYKCTCQSVLMDLRSHGRWDMNHSWCSCCSFPRKGRKKSPLKKIES